MKKNFYVFLFIFFISIQNISAYHVYEFEYQDELDYYYEIGLIDEDEYDEFSLKFDYISNEEENNEFINTEIIEDEEKNKKFDIKLN